MSAEALRPARLLRESIYEERALTRRLERLAGLIPFCHQCGWVQQPGEKFEDRIEGYICPECIARELERGI